MSSSRPEPPVDLGIYSRVDHRDGLDPADKIAIGVTAVWVALCTIFAVFVGFGEGDNLGPLRFLILVLSILLPIALIWIASIAVKSARIMQDESERLQASMDAMRQIYVTQAQMSATTMGPNVERKIDQIVKGQKRAEDALASFATTRQPSRIPDAVSDTSVGRSPHQDHQTTLAFAQEAPKRVSNADFIIAMNFPETADDAEGFGSLRRALADPRAARLVQSSQDTLTLLSQDGIYMDDLSPDRSRPDVWRQFAKGERGPTVAGLGGVRDRSSLALSAARIRQDSIFRDATHHFLRTFDQTLASIEAELSDQEIAALSETRTARAFMLLGRVTGIFD